jgi:DNA polymerase-3 subunit beta
MEIRIPAVELVRALNMLQGVVQKKNTMPILSHVLLEAKRDPNGSGELRMSVTDLDIGLHLSKACEILEEGTLTVSARAFLDIARMLPGPGVTLRSMPNQQISIKSGRTNAKLLGLPADEFPRSPDIEQVPLHNVDAKLLADMLQKTLYSTSMDENRYNLTGVYLEPQRDFKNRLAMVSTDGHRLSRVECEFGEAELPFNKPAILPRKGLYELLKVLSEESGSEKALEIGFSTTQAIVRIGQTVLTMRLIDGAFPDYNQVIPKLSDKIIRASRADLLTSAKRVSVLATDKNQCMKIAIKNKEITVSCVNPEAGEVSDDVPVEYAGSDIEIGFNVRYIVDALSSITDTVVMIKLTDALSPALITSANQGNHLCVVMPMRL